MRPAFVIGGATCFLVSAMAAACGSPPGMPTAGAPTMSTITAPSVPVGLNLSGKWHGIGGDAQGAEQLTWTLAQDGTTLSGSAELAPTDAADGSCGSCHKFKSGTFTGTLSGTAVTMKLVFPSGGDGVPTPMCSVAFDLTATAATPDRLLATYSGGDSCEGTVSDGALTMTRQ